MHRKCWKCAQSFFLLSWGKAFYRDWNTLVMSVIMWPYMVYLCGFETWTVLADWKRNPGFRNQMPEETSLHLLLAAHDRQLGAKQDQLPCGATETSSGNCQETESCVVQACHMPWQPPQNYSSGHLGGWVMSWSAEEMLDGHQRVDIPVHSRTVYKGLLQKRLEEDICWIIPYVPQMTQLVKGLNWAERWCSCSCSWRPWEEGEDRDLDTNLFIFSQWLPCWLWALSKVDQQSTGHYPCSGNPAERTAAYLTWYWNVSGALAIILVVETLQKGQLPTLSGTGVHDAIGAFVMIKP